MEKLKTINRIYHLAYLELLEARCQDFSLLSTCIHSFAGLFWPVFTHEKKRWTFLDFAQILYGFRKSSVDRFTPLVCELVFLFR